MLDVRDQACFTKHMKIQEVINYYGTRKAVAAALGITKQAVSQWEAEDSIPPLRQLQLQELTKRKLRADRAQVFAPAKSRPGKAA